MTPTLVGRWQTRLLLLCTVGFGISLLFGLIIDDLRTPLALLLYTLFFGFAWDMLYNFLQSFRWEHDWPPPLQLAAGVVEAVWIWGLIQATSLWQWVGLTQLPGVNTTQLTFGLFLTHYTLVWLGIYLSTQGPLRILFPRWRYRGGEWI